MYHVALFSAFDEKPMPFIHQKMVFTSSLIRRAERYLEFTNEEKMV